MNPNPIFIVGAPRSGTSVLRVTLNRHPSICLCDETSYFYQVYTRRRAFGDLSDPKRRRLLVSPYLATRRIQSCGLPHDALADALMREGTSYDAFFTTLIRFAAMQQGKNRFGEKTPGHALFTETLLEWYPGCSIIHIVRDPRDVVASLQRMPFASDDVTVNVRDWLKYNSAAERSRHRSGYLCVSYEEFIEDTEAVLKRILSSIGETFYPEMLDAKGTESSGIGQDIGFYHQRAQKPLQKSRMGKWREELSEKQVATIEWIAGKKMRAYGYELTGQTISPGERASALLGENFDKIVNRVKNFRRLYYYWLQPTQLVAEEDEWRKERIARDRR